MRGKHTLSSERILLRVMTARVQLKKKLSVSLKGLGSKTN
jgi:hypothetical protein